MRRTIFALTFVAAGGPTLADDTPLTAACRVAIGFDPAKAEVRSETQVFRHVTIRLAGDGLVYDFHCYFRNLDDRVPELEAFKVYSGNAEITGPDALEGANERIWDHFTNGGN